MEGGSLASELENYLNLLLQKKSSSRCELFYLLEFEKYLDIFHVQF